MSATVVPDPPNTAVLVTVTNLGTRTFDVFPGAFVLTTRDGAQPTRIKPSEYIKKIQTNAMWNNVLIGVGSFALAHTSYSESSSASVGAAAVASDGSWVVGAAEASSTTHGTVSTSADKIAATTFAVDQIRANQAAAMRRVEAAQDFLLQANTVSPGESVYGAVVFQYKSVADQRFRIHLSVTDDDVVIPGRTPE